MTRTLFAAVLAVFSAVAAHAVTLDYDAAPAKFTSYDEDGFNTSVDRGTIDTGYFRPGAARVVFQADATATIMRIGGGAFSVSSIDLVQWSPMPITAIFEAQTSGGGTIQQMFSNVTSLSTFNFASGFGDIVSLSFTQNAFSGRLGAYGFDNVVVDAVAPIPLPASSLLLLAGLGGLVTLRRARRA